MESVSDPRGGRLPDVYRLTLGDRREIVQLLERLTPSARIAWLRSCCRLAKLGNTTTMVDPRTRGEVNEIYLDWVSLTTQFRVPVTETVEDLLRLVQVVGKPLLVSARG